MRRRGKEYRQVTEHVILVTQLGLTMAGSILFCFAIGYYLDKWLGTNGLFLAVFIVLGVFGGGWTVYRQIMAAADDDDFRDPEGGGE
jgi:ATP synthase protein I